MLYLAYNLSDLKKRHIKLNTSSKNTSTLFDLTFFSCLFFDRQNSQFQFIFLFILPENFLLIILFMCLATNCVANIDQSKRENKK
jgi:hypothetical protein